VLYFAFFSFSRWANTLFNRAMGGSSVTRTALSFFIGNVEVCHRVAKQRRNAAELLQFCVFSARVRVCVLLTFA
jgi:hypothetical protein